MIVGWILDPKGGRGEKEVAVVVVVVVVVVVFYKGYYWVSWGNLTVDSIRYCV